MNDKIPKIKSCLLSFAILLFSQNVYSQSAYKNFLEFSLSLQNISSDLNFSTSTYSTKTSQMSINWYEPFTQYFHGGLELGYLEMTQIDNPITSAQFTSGEYLGVLFRFMPITTEFISLTLNMNYRYNRTSGKTTDQETQFSWNETMLSSEIRYYPVNNVSFMAGIDYQYLSGEQRDTGIINKISNFHENTPQNYRAGINFSSSQGGVIGLEWMTGFKNGTRLYFLRKF